MINKYQFLLSGSNENNQTTIASIFVGGNFLLPLSASTDNGIIDFYMSWANYDANTGQITSFYPYDGSGYYSRRFPDNNYGFVYGGAPIITGYTLVQDLQELLSTSQKSNFANQTTNYVHSASGSSIKVGVEFEDVFENDTFVNVGLTNNFGSLETLTIKNNALGNWNTINSPTGIVFGTLTATQNINDENGNPLQIPLRNVPVMIFNQTNNNITTINPAQSGRMALNMIQNSERDHYTNDFAYNFDQQILPNITTKNVTDTYQWSTMTNDNGEYILRDVPVGVQNLIIEIDLLKQGLTQEEVELNVGPYPKTNNPTPEQMPHLIYREIPINVLPSWGYLNTGYTNCDINIAVDLRKWATFFVPPVTAYGKTYDEILQSGFQPNLSIRVRDMAQRGVNGEIFPTTSIECVNIPDVTQRDTTRLLGWTNETRQLRDLIVFNELQYNAFKVPANIYDPNAYKTDGSGNTISDKGVWLASYEFKMFFTNEGSFFRATGFNLGTTSKNTVIIPETLPFNLFSETDGNTNLTIGNTGITITYLSTQESYQNNFDLTNNNSSSTGVTVGVFPYEKPWTTNYPTPYSIPKIPNQINTNITYNDDGIPKNTVIPKYLDGDRVGAKTTLNGINFGGWGAQIDYGNEVYPNYFAQQVTTSELYRYESAISPLDEFSNGYTPNFPYGNVPSNQNSNVVNGELYQRVECGHGYFMWIQGFPRVVNLSGYDEMYAVDYLSGGTTGVTIPNFTGESGVLYYPSYINDNFLFNNDTLLATDFIQLKDYQKGYIYLYKITDPDPSLLAPPTPPLQKRSVNLNFQNIYIQRGGTAEDALAVLGTTDKLHRFKFYNYIDEYQNSDPGAVLTIINNGIVSVEISIGQNTQKIIPGQSFGFPLIDVANQKIINLPTNDVFDFGINTYYNTNYTMTIDNLQFYFPNGDKSIYVQHLGKDLVSVLSSDTNSVSTGGIKLTGATNLEGVSTYYLVSNAGSIKVRGPQGKPKPNGLIIDCQCQADIQGLLLVSSDNTYINSYQFRPQNTHPDGGNGENLPYTYINSD